MAEIEIEIDGQKMMAQPGQTVIQVADEAGVYIPRFCYHKSLSIVANCRMCLVEVEKSPKALPACATPVMPGMKVFTKSQKTVAAQRAVMEFLLINHPLDCPICDQGGECELQDLSMGYGSSLSHYEECKRSIADQNLGPLIATEMTRCIYCTRCVRFGEEIAGFREMGAIGRGEDTEIGTYIQHAIHSEVSGNIIDLCPVGALTSKPYRFTSRAWELDQAPSISPHDCLGANINVHTRYGIVKRVVSRENEAINETWLADRDRFAYPGLYHPDRLEEPLIRIDGQLQVATWEQALLAASTGLKDTIAAFGADKVAALATPNATLEEYYLLQKIIRGLGSPHIDYRLREMHVNEDAPRADCPILPFDLAELSDCQSVLLIGSNIQREQPLAALRIRKAALKGARISVINSVDYDFHFSVTAKQIVAPHLMIETLTKLANALSSGTADDDMQGLIASLKEKEKVIILLGAQAINHPQSQTIRRLAADIAITSGAKLGVMTEGANSAGAWLSGAVPHRHPGENEIINHVGLSAYSMLQKPRKGYLLLNVEPDFDTANPASAFSAMQQAKCIVALSTFRNSVLEQYAHVILPMAPFTETAGTYVNVAGTWQSFKGTAKAFGQSRPGWKILRVLGNFLELHGFDYETSTAIRDEVKGLTESISFTSSQAAEKQNGGTTPTASNVHLSRIGEIPIYAGDNLVRRSNPLQATQHIMMGDTALIKMHPETARQHQLELGDKVEVRQGTAHAILQLELDERIAKDAVWIAGAISATSGLGDLFDKVEVKKS